MSVGNGMESPRRVSSKRYNTIGRRTLVAVGETHLAGRMGLAVGREQREAVGCVTHEGSAGPLVEGLERGIVQEVYGREASRLSGLPECGR